MHQAAMQQTLNGKFDAGSMTVSMTTVFWVKHVTPASAAGGGGRGGKGEI
jgi:hypothetical protein